MRHLNLVWQMFLLVMLPAAAALAENLFKFYPANADLITMACLMLCLLGSTLFTISLVKRLRIIADNGYRFANNLPRRALPAGKDEVSQVDEVVQNVYRRMDSTTGKYKACLANSADIICTLQPTGMFSMVSEASRRVLGYESFYMTGRSVDEFLVSEDRTTLTSAQDQAQTAPDTPVNFELRMRRRNGSICWTFWSVTWAAKEDAFFCNLKDISQQKEVEQLKQEFFNMVSHDLRSPLLSITSVFELLENDRYGQLDSEGHELIRDCRYTTRRLIELINDLLDMEKMGEGKLELDLCDLNIWEIIHDAVASLKPIALQKSISITFGEQQDLPVEADPQRMVQVLQNLISNAVKFCPTGSEIQVTAAREKDDILIKLKDNGPGIPADKLDYIFDRFRQLPHSTGSGLGLAICRLILEQHHGSIGAINNDDGGSTFWLKIPAARAVCADTMERSLSEW